MLGAVGALYLICCLSLALTRAPWYDEGFVVNPSYAWITSGHPGMSILDGSGPWFPKNVIVAELSRNQHPVGFFCGRMAAPTGHVTLLHLPVLWPT